MPFKVQGGVLHSAPKGSCSRVPNRSARTREVVPHPRLRPTIPVASPVWVLYLSLSISSIYYLSEVPRYRLAFVLYYINGWEGVEFGLPGND